MYIGLVCTYLGLFELYIWLLLSVYMASFECMYGFCECIYGFYSVYVWLLLSVYLAFLSVYWALWIVERIPAGECGTIAECLLFLAMNRRA